MSASVVGLLLRRFTLRHWRGSPRQTLLLVSILALGVGVFVSVRLANRAAISSFTHFTETLTGQSDWILTSPAGPLPESVLTDLRRGLEGRPVHIIPVVEVTASVPVDDGQDDRFGRPSYTLLGVDLLSLANLARPGQRSFFGDQEGNAGTAPGSRSGAGGTPTFWDNYLRGLQAWVSPAFADPLPASIDLVIAEKVQTLPVAGAIPSTPDTPQAPANLIILEREELQRLAGKEGRLDRIEFLVEPGHGEAERRLELRLLLEKLGGERWLVSAPGARRESAETMTRAFRLNLTVLSLIALLVGLYLIFQALDGEVVRRRPEIAVLRSLGVEEGTILRVWLLESMLLGTVGGALGLLLGWAGAQVSVRAVGQTVNALYFGTTVQAAMLTPLEIGIGLVLGMVSALIAGLIPAREAARTPPAHVLQRSGAPPAGPAVLSSWILGGGLIAAGVLAAGLPPLRFDGGSRFPVAGYGAAFLWIAGFGLLTSFLLPAVGRAGRRAGAAWPAARIALSHIRKPSGRHRLAAAALVCAIGMTSGMAILVASFEHTMQGWVKRTLHADLYVSSAGAQSASARNPLSAAVAARIMAHPAVAHASALVSHPVVVDGLQTTLNGGDLGNEATRPDTTWIDPPREPGLFDSTHNADRVLVSESFSERFRKRQGDRIRVPTPTGAREVVIAGVFADYGNERGSILADRRHVQAWFEDDSVTNIALFLRPGADEDTVRLDLLRQYPGLTLYTNMRLRTEVLRIFRQTFSITYALEVIGVVVAVAGLALTLSSVLLDRRDELTTLRSLGFTHREIAVATGIEGLAVSLAAIVGGLGLSLALGWLLIHVINKQSFGWTLGFAIPGWQLAALALSVALTGAVVSYAVGRWGAALPADREEE